MEKYDLQDSYIKSINSLYKKKIFVIHNVYQEVYANNNKVTGFGDFIRGCYFLFEFCETLKFKPNIIINHPVALFLTKFDKHYKINKQKYQTIFSSIKKFKDDNFLNPKLDENNYIIDEKLKTKTLYGFIDYLCDHAFVNKSGILMYNILFPYKKIPEK